MKRILFILLACIPLSSYSQSLDGMWGLKFYMSKDEVKSAVKAKTGKLPATSTSTMLEYEDCEFAGRFARLIRLNFHHDSLYKGDIAFFPKSDPGILSLYNSIKDDLIKKYGAATISAERYESPFEKGDGNEVTAIKTGHSTIGSLWYFPKGQEKNVNGRVMLSVEETMLIRLSYSDALIENRLVNENKSKSQGDY